MFHAGWYCPRVTQKRGKLTAESVDGLQSVVRSISFETGRSPTTYLDSSTDDPVAGVGIHYVVTLDGAELEEFTVRRSGVDAPRLTRRLLRDAPVDSIAERARRELRSESSQALSEYMLDNLEGIPVTQQDGSVLPFRMQGIRKHVGTDWTGFKRPGKAGRPDIEYAEIAESYVQECEENGGNGAAKRVAASKHLNQKTVLNLLNEAVRRGLKTPAPPGKAGGQLTLKAIGLLREPRS